MGKSFKGFSKALSMILTVAMVATMMPATPVLADELLADESVDLLTSETLVEESDAAVSDSVDALITDDSSNSIDTGKEAAPEADILDQNTSGKEGFGNDKAYQDTTLTIGTIPANAGLFTLNGGVATALSAGDISITSDEDFVAYVVPEVTYELDAAPVTVAGTYTDGSTTVKAEDNFTVSDIDELDVTDSGPTNVPLAKNIDAGDYYWNKGKKITISKRFLATYKEKTGSGLTLTAKNPTTRSAYTIPVYIYDNASEATSPTYHKYALSSRITPIAATSGTAINPSTTSIANALTAEDWAGYTWAGDFVMLKKDLSGDVAIADTQSDPNLDGTGDFYVDISNKKFGTFTDTTSLAFLDREKSVGAAIPAIVLTKTPKSVTSTYTVSGADTDYVDFTFGTSATATSITRAGDATTDVKPATAGLGADEIAAVVKDYTGGSAAKLATLGDGSTHPARTLVAGNKSLQYTPDGGEAAFLTYSTDHWVLPAEAKDVVVSAKTTETVEFIGKSTNMDKVTAKFTALESPTATTSISFTGNKYADFTGATGIYTGSEAKFSLVPLAGHKINSVKVTKYDHDGSAGSQNVPLTPVDNVYTISNIVGYTQIVIDAEAIESTVTVKKGTGSNYKLTDVNTDTEINTSGASYGETGKLYTFKAEAATGYTLTGVTAKAGDADITVNAGTTAGLYTISAADMSKGGPIVITGTVEAAVGIKKYTNPDAVVTVAGSAVADGASVTVSKDAALTFTVTGNNGATIDNVYWTTGSVANYSDFGSVTKYELTGSNGSYTIAKNDMTAAAGSTITIIALTTRDAIAGTDYSAVKVVDAGNKDITEGLTLWAADGTSATSNAVGDTPATRTLKATWTLSPSGTLDTTSPGTTKLVSFELGKTAATEKIAKFDDSTKNLLIPEKYVGGDAETTTDTVTMKVTTVENSKTFKFPNTVVYKAQLPLTVKPLRSKYASYEYDVVTAAATTAGLPAKTIRAVTTSPFGTDTAVFTPKGVAADGTTKTTVASTDAFVSSLSWSVTPIPGTTAALAKYAISIDANPDQYTTLNQSGNVVTVKKAAKAQELTVSTKVSFVDGTETTIQDTLDVIDVDYGYFAIPTYSVTGGADNTILASGTPGAMTLETKGTVASGTVTYTVYHALDTTGAAYLGGYTFSDAAALTKAITDGHIEAVPASSVTWTGLTPSTTGYASYLQVTSAGAGKFTLKGLKKTNTLTPAYVVINSTSLAAKVGDYVVKSPTTINVTVVQEVQRVDLLVNSQDTLGGTGFLYPELTWNPGSYTASAVSSPETGKRFLDVPVGTTFTLPGISAFKAGTYNPQRTLAGWIDNTNTTYKIGDSFTTAAASTLTPVWAYRFAAKSGTTVAINDSDAGKIVAINGKTEAAVGPSTKVAVGETLPIYAGYYALDTSVAPTYNSTANKVKYAADLTQIKTGLELKTTSLAEGYTFFGADQTTGVFANATLTGKEVSTGYIDATLTYTESADVTYTATVPSISCSAAETWTLEIENQTVENTQAEDFTIKTLKLGDVDKKLTAIGSDIKSLTFTSSNDEVATVAIKSGSEASNTLTVTGKAVGTATITAKLISAANVVKTTTFTVTVTKAAVSIVAKVTPGLTNPNKAAQTVTVAEGSVMELMIGSNELALSAVDADGHNIDTVNFGSTISATAPTTDSMGISTGTVSIATGNKVTLSPSALGTAKFTITATSGGKTYTREIDAISYGTVALVGPVSSSGSITDAKTSTATGSLDLTTYFDMYEGATTVAANKFAAGKIGYIPVKYVKDATSYTASLDGYSAVWTKDGTQEFFGWGTTANATKNTTAAYANHKALKNGTITLTKSNVETAGGFKLYPEFGGKPITSIGTIDDVIRLTDEKVDTEATINGITAGAKAATDGTNWVDYNIQVLPASATETISVIASETGIIDFASKGHTAAAGYGKASDPTSVDTSTNSNRWDGTVEFELYANGTATARRDNLRIAKVDNKAGAFDVIVTAGSLDPKTIKVYANGEYQKAGDAVNWYYMEDGSDVKSAIKTVNSEEHVFDKDGKRVAAGTAEVTIDGKTALIMVESNKWFKTKGVYTYTDATTGAVTDYFINADGVIETGLLNKADTGLTVDRYADTGTGAMIKYADTEKAGTPGKWTDSKTKVTYVIDKDTNAAKEDDKFAVTGVKWAAKPTVASFVNNLPVVTATVTLKSQKTGETHTEDLTASVIKTDYDKKAVFTATLDLSNYYNTSYTAKAENKDKDYTYYKDADGNLTDKGAGAEEGGKAASEPEESAAATYRSYNLFYTDTVIPVAGIDEANADDAVKAGKWTEFYVIDGGSVKVKDGADAKKAANASNSLIEITSKDGDEVFSYQLPVYYLKPSLKLTSTSGTVNKSAYATTTLYTTVTEKKSNGLYEPIEVDAEADPAEVTFVPSGNKPVLTLANGENAGDIAITATAKTSGKLSVKCANWREEVKLSYSVKESSKDVFEISTKKVFLNSKMEGDAEQVVTLTLNGGEDMTGVTADYPKSWGDAGVEIEGVDESKNVTSNELKVKFIDDATHKKGNYTVTFKTSSNVKVKLTVAVSDKNEAKNLIKLTVKSKMDITTGQKMVVVPELKQVGGPIEDVTIETVGNFGCEYNQATNQIIVTSVNPNLTKGKYTQTFHVTTAVAEFDVELKNFQVNATKPSVKVANVTLPKDKIGTTPISGWTNVNATYRQNGKTFSTAPLENGVTFPNGIELTDDQMNTEGLSGDGWYKDSKTNVFVRYCADTGRIEIKAGKDVKTGGVKVDLMFKGQTTSLKKSFKIVKGK